MEGSKEYSDGNSAVEKQLKRTEELFNKCKPALDDDLAAEIGEEKAWAPVKSLCQKHSELIDDFAVVKDINSAIAERFNLVVDKFPITLEIDFLIDHLEDIHINSELEIDKQTVEQRRLILKSFRKIIVALDQHNENIRPKSYEESVESKEVKSDE
ncbi:MAG: hypothetical protein KC589_07860 [Nanoarchaeota archaeon]|nr:hypothetical protein [Nanoarchaeota archaeon]